VPLSTAFSELDPRTTTPVSDLSRHGVFVHTDELLPVGAPIDLCFIVFPEKPVVFRAHGRVVRQSDDPVGMGVEFVELDEVAAGIVEEIMRRHDDNRGDRTTRRRRFERAVFDPRAIRKHDDVDAED
jgi:hypothetical protein